ncbi:YlbF family regulator [Streptococcus equinus]|uniref:YlbF family regulator n=1 Tax=Streptococcus equinus TaxID=1335 RepID=UPI0015F4A174|nr:YlbF family regulator [Streptococcus equinus]QMS96009.1 YlbF family regulator [Streptococcus equinus]
MLAIDEQLLEIDEAIDDVAQTFFTLDSVKSYLEIKQEFLADSALQEKIVHFQELKQSYEENKDYLAFRPEVRELRRQLIKEKRILDMNEKVSRLRQSEVEVQEILAELSQKVSSAISSTIFVDTGLPLAPHKSHHHCRGKEKRDV